MNFESLSQEQDKSIRSFIAVDISNTAKQCIEEALSVIKKNAKNIQGLMKRLAALKIGLIAPITIDHVTLYKSTLTSVGAFYEPIDKIAFA